MAHRLLHNYGVVTNSPVPCPGSQCARFAKASASLIETKDPDAFTELQDIANPLPIPSSIPPRRSLCQQASKLDLIDGTTLTSLPLPPPPPLKLKRGDLASSCLSRGSGSLTNSYKPESVLSSNNANSVPSSHSGANVGNSSFNSDLIEDTFDESEDPIVLVEDYMTDDVSEKQIQRKKSLMTFKKRIYSQESNPSPSFLRKRLIDDDNNSICKKLNQCEDLEAIFGKIPGTDRLKHCELCDRPLYEISSIIGLTQNETNPANSFPSKSRMSELYNEFICWDCINLYENFLEELYASELSQDIADSSSTNKLLSIFCSIRNTYTTDQPPRKQSQRPFSNNLLGRLHHLNSTAKPAKVLELFKVLRDKLRWRWRLNGLIPNLFSFDRRV